ncbi:MAG: 16S rRNA (uracil(1498)-N(3))-methyltransferase [Clostridia bacterium]|nr:16S rRNA (uracil(1498)-N(3))-methyltransferase [Clostridia bacterium]
MPRFFVGKDQIEGDRVTILGDDAHHLSRALRMAAGERITVCDMENLEYECELTDFLPDRVCARVLETHACETEPPYQAHVYQALPKGEKLDSVIQKAVECGAHAVTTFESERCIVRLKGENEGKKVERRQRIAHEAAKQCGRGVIPAVHPTVSFVSAVTEAARADLALFCYEGKDTEPLPAVLQRWKETYNGEGAPTISILIGSEGGFSPTEAEQAVRAGLLPVGLGKRILRTETAAAFALACLVYELEMR